MIAFVLEKPKQAWQKISMDFVEGLPRYKGKNSIMVVVDRLIKFDYFLNLAHPFTTPYVARWLDSMVKVHGLLVSITLDRDKVFTSNFWRELFK